MKRTPLPVLDAALSLGGVLAPPLALQGIGDGSRKVGEKIADQLPGWLEAAGRFEDTALDAASNPLVAVTAAYQEGYALLPDVLVGSPDTNGRNVLILGGLAESHIRKVQRSLGEEQDVEDERLVEGPLGTETVTSRGRRRQEGSFKSFNEFKYLRRGEQLWMGVRAGADQKPVKTRARRLKPPETYRRRQAARAKASAPRRKARR